MSLSLSPSPRPAEPVHVGRRVAWQLPLALALAVLSVIVLGLRFELVGCLYIALVTPELCRVDLAHHRLPNALVVPGIAAAAIGVVFGGLADGRVPAAAVASVMAIGAFFALLTAAGGLGAGDVKLSIALALAGGGASVMIAVGTVVIGFLVAGVAAMTMIVARGAGGSIAFGPYLLGGFWTSVAALPLLA